VSIRFRPKPDEIGYLYHSFRDRYVDNLIRPELRSAVRRIIGQYTPEELYATKRQEIETAIQLSTESILDSNHVELRALLFRSIKLPETIKVSIEEKLKADQESQKREYLQEIAEKDAAIRITEAKGKAEANRILSASLTDKILKEKGIQATEELAKSPNTKVVVVGSGKDGLPIILGGN
jgi:regulator of protease activity HflC (stomatin/prohibitin superfamily)